MWRGLQRVDKPSHSLSVLRAGTHECQIRSAPVLVLPRLQRRQRAKIKFILALCQQSETLSVRRGFQRSLFYDMDWASDCYFSRFHCNFT
ncbi:hypothetical protein EVS87_007135 [Bacillus altitudinis]|nr:hypothetical protein EVS87_007135 [Bacillus altitudinis]